MRYYQFEHMVGQVGASALFTNDDMVFAQRLNIAIHSLAQDMSRNNWDTNHPLQFNSYQVFIASWDPFFGQTQDTHSILVGVNNEALTQFQQEYESWRTNYTSIQGKPPTMADPIPPKPGENAPQINLGGMGGLGLGVGLVGAAALVYWFVKR
jgi:hypothetical protein